MDETTKDFIEENGLNDSIQWLESNFKTFFSAAKYKIKVIGAEEDDPLLTLIIYDAYNLTVREFSNKRHVLCEGISNAGYQKLRLSLSIFRGSIL